MPAGAALVRPVDPAAAGRAGLPGRRRHRRLQRGRPRAGAPAGGPAELAGANRWLELARSAAFSAGPAAAVSALGASAAYALATALSLLAALLLAGLPADAPAATATRRHIGRELSDGAAFVLRHPLLRPVLVTAVFFNVAWFVLQAVYVVYAIRDLELDAAGVGLTLGIYGLGMLAGALLAPRLARWLSFGALIAAGPLCALLASA